MKRLFIGLVTVSLIIFGYLQVSQTSSKKNSQTKTSENKNMLSPYPTRKFPPVVKYNRRPPSINKASKPQKLEGIMISPGALRIGKSFQLVKNLNAIHKTAYSPKFGKKIKEDKYFVFFKPNHSNRPGFPVAFNASRQKLFPISHILHLRGIDSSERDQFKAEGMSEFYYHAPLKMLSLNTSPATVVQQYQSLKARGFDVRLEVLKETVQAR